ncbi:MAG: BspA family leucine-rich repeat surface protein [Balneolaceae bacterium]|nr:BspA family leucine-rich repeat surface protein [Balneolaceae bacterium]
MTNYTKAFLSQFILLFFLVLVPLIQAQSFQVLPSPAIHADAVSPDGRVVAGYTTVDAGNQGYIWTENDGLTLLGTLPGHSNSRATGVASNGQAVVGGIFSPDRAYRWTPNGGMISLGSTNELASFAFDVSADGSVVVGRDQNRNLSYQAFRWTAGGGMELLGGFIEGDHPSSEAHSVSADGNVITGHSPMFNPGWELQAFRWTSQNGMVPIGEIIQDSRVIVSADGNTIIGTFNPGDGVQGFRWTASTGRVALGKLPGRLNSVARGVSADGSVVVGWSRGELNEDRDAFVWTEATGMRRLQDVLEDEYGLDLTGWSLREAYDISDDGSVIVGWGRDPENERRVFRVTLTEPSVIIVNSATDNPHDSSSTTECDTGELVEIDGEEVPECTLRAAIQTANARGGATIHFDIPGDPLIFIEDGDDPLPPFESRIILDGTTQAGGFVELAGPLQGSEQGIEESNTDLVGLNVKPGGGGSEIRGMVVHSFIVANIKIGTGANGTVIENNRIGTDYSGTTAKGGGSHVCIVGGIPYSEYLGRCEQFNIIGWPYITGAGLHIMSSDNHIRDNVIAGNSLLKQVGTLFYGSVQVLIDYMAHNNRLYNNNIGIGSTGDVVNSRPELLDFFGSFGRNARGIDILGSNNIIGGAPETANRIGGHYIDLWVVNSAADMVRFDGSGDTAVPGPEGVRATGNVISHNTFGISSSFATFNEEQKEIYGFDNGVWLFGQQNRFENNEMATHRQSLYVGGESNTATGNHIKAWDIQLSNSSMWDLLAGSIDGAVIVTGKNHQVKLNTIESGEWGIQVTGTGKELDISENVIQSDEGGILISNVSRFADFEDYRLNGTIVNNNDIESDGYGILITDGVEATFKANKIKASGSGIVLPSVEDFERHNILSSDGWQRVLLKQNQIDSPVGIDLKGDGVSLRHLFIGENGPNGMLNYPVISQAVRSGNTLQFEGWFDHSVFGNKEYTIEVFGNTGCAANMYTYGSYYGAGHEYIGSHYITPLASALGNSALSFSVSGLKDEHRYVTATVSIAEEFITSEFSMCLPISVSGQTVKADTDPDASGLLLADMGVTVSTGDGIAKMNSTAGAQHNGGTLFVTKYDELPEFIEFGSFSAQSNSGNQLIPKEIAPGYWMINKFGFEVPDGSDPVEFEVCLDPTGIVHTNDLKNSVIVKRNEISEGIWNPLDSSEKFYDGITYLCAAGITEFSDFSIAAEEFLGEDSGPDFSPFITTWQVEEGDLQISIPMIGNGYDFTIDWGDGTDPEDYSNNPGDGVEHSLSHTYSEEGEYEVSISGDFPRIYFFNSPDSDKIIDVVQWGDIEWSSMERAFTGASNLNISATDAPDLSSVESMRQMFNLASSLNADLNHWDTSNITDMYMTFRRAAQFNGNIEDWKTGKVTDMSNMFIEAEMFNQDIGGWDVGEVRNMAGMFRDAKAFNQNIGSWTTVEVTNMNNLFRDAESFNGDISQWETDKVESMANMFEGATAFNQDISGWKTGNLESAFQMFNNAQNFDQDLGDWDLSSVSVLEGYESTTGLGEMFNNSGLSTENYDATLIGWAVFVENNDGPKNIVLGTEGLTYCNGADARESLINDHGWTINGDEESATCGEAPEGEDQRVLALNNTTYVFSGSDFGLGEGQSVKINSLPGKRDLNRNADDVLTFAQLNNGDLTYDSQTISYGYGYDSFEFTILGGQGTESKEAYTMTIDLAATHVMFDGQEGWRFISPPTEGESVGSLFNSVWTQGFPDSNSPNAAFNNVLQVNYAAYDWAPVSSSNSSVPPGVGTIIYVYEKDNTSDSFPKTISISNDNFFPYSDGIFWEGLFYDASQNEEDVTYLLLGNPTPYALDYCEFSRVRVADNITIWDPNTNSGAYLTMSCSEGPVAVAPLQAFWIRVQDNNPDLRFDTDAFLGEPVEGYFKQVEQDNDPFIVRLDVTGGPQSYTDGVHILFSEQSTHGHDLMDAPKLASSGLANRWLSFYALDDEGESYAIRSLPNQFDSQLTIPLGIETTEIGSYTLTWTLPEASHFSGSYYLRDTHTGSLTELREGQRYHFEIDESMAAKASNSPLERGSNDACGDEGVCPSVPGAFAMSTTEQAPRFELILSSQPLEDHNNLPTCITLAQNYPNPFNPSTQIRYELPQTEQVRLDVFDMTGRHVATLIDGQVSAGTHTVNFDARNLSSGIYIYRLQAGGQLLTRQLTLIK